jgi:hypothetical protein
MDLTQLRVKSGDLVSAQQWNTLVDWIGSLLRESGSGLFRSPSGRHRLPDVPSNTVAARWCIIREVVDDADLSVRIELAGRGRNFAEAAIPEDYGRYVGGHEMARTADAPPDPIPPFDDYLVDATVFPHTVGMDWRYFVWPHAEDPGDPFYRDTDVEGTDIVLALQVAGDWIVFPIYRDYNGEVSETARQYDCIVEA